MQGDERRRLNARRCLEDHNSNRKSTKTASRKNRTKIDSGALCDE